MFAFPIALLLGIERFSWRRTVGLCLGLFSVMLMVAPETSLPEKMAVVFIPIALIAPIFYAFEGNYVAKWGDSYCGRALSMQGGTNEDYEWTHIWDIKIDDPIKFKTAHDKIVKKFKKEFEGRFVAFGAYDINYPDGATHWVVVSGKDDSDHMMLYDKLQKQPEFIELIVERGKVKNVKDYMVKDLKTYY